MSNDHITPHSTPAILTVGNMIFTDPQHLYMQYHCMNSQKQTKHSYACNNIPMQKKMGKSTYQHSSNIIIIIIIIHFIETRLQYNWLNNKNTDGLVNRLASDLVILNQAHRVAWLSGQEKILK